MPDRNYFTSGGQRGRERQENRENESERGGERGRSGSGEGGESNYGSPSYGRVAGSSGTSDYGRSEYGYGDRADFGGGQSNFGTGRRDTSRRDAGRDEEWRGYGGGRGGEQDFENASGWYEPFGQGRPYRADRSQRGGSAEPRQHGQHRGKGPKGYQRSDERLKELICERLREDPEIDPGEVTVNVSGARVTLDGTVDSRRTKNAIEDIVEQFDVTDVENNLRVSRATGMGAQGSQSEWGKSASAEDKESSSKLKKN